MSPTNLLDEILTMLQSLKDNPQKLAKLHQYILNELYTGEDAAGESIVIPKHYALLVKEVADSLSAAMVCYINPATLEKIDIPQSVIDTIFFDEEDDEDNENDEEEGDLFYADLKRIKRDWEQTVTINPPESGESFTFMERFVNTLPESRLSKMLSEALSGRKPFRHFNNIIHQSAEREAWFAFRQKCLEIYAAEILADKIWNNELGS